MPVQRQIARALDVAARGEMAELAKPLKGLGVGVFEVALRYRTDAFAPSTFSNWTRMSG